MSGPAIQHSIAAAQHAAATAPLPGTHSFWITLLIGLLIARIAAGWVFGILLVVALAALGVLGRLSHTSGGGDASLLVWLIVVAIAVVVGLYFGRMRGLRHLGESEFRTRLTNIRRISRF
jgi:hypothetical protein